MINNREQYALEKYMKANVIRESKQIIKNQSRENTSLEQLSMKKQTQIIKDLEEKVITAWKEKEKLNYYKKLKQKSIEIKNYFHLHRKVEKLAKSQELKLIRKDRPRGPKIDPLPYLKKIRDNLSKSIDVEYIRKNDFQEPLSFMLPLNKLNIKLKPRVDFKPY